MNVVNIYLPSLKLDKKDIGLIGNHSMPEGNDKEEVEGLQAQALKGKGPIAAAVRQEAQDGAQLEYDLLHAQLDIGERKVFFVTFDSKGDFDRLLRFVCSALEGMTLFARILIKCTVCLCLCHTFYKTQ